MIPPSFRFLVVGVNHRTAPVNVREGLAFSDAQAALAIRSLKQKFPETEAVILSTCNRVEIYLAAPNRTPSVSEPPSADPTLLTLTDFIADFHSFPAAALAPHLYHHEDHAMIHHLFAVASSLDSMVVGETQILGQVKAAYQLARETQSVGKIFHALFQRTLAAAKDVHEQTHLSAGRLSVASVAVDVARSVFDRFDDKTVVCIGAGKTAALMLRHLKQLNPKRLLITNRTLERAQSLAEEFAAEARPFEQLDDLLIEADILLTSTGAEQPILTEPRLRAILKPRRYRPMVIVDIAVPRDVEAAVGKLSNIYLYNIDDLQEVAAGNRGKREAQIAASRALLTRHVDSFHQWFAARDVGPVVKALYDHCHSIARAELDSVFAKNPNMLLEDRAELERMTHRLVGKILHGPVSQLTTDHPANTAPPALTPAELAAALKKLFNLDDPPPQK